MLVRADKIGSLQPVADFLYGKEVGEIMSNNGLFPSLNPEVRWPVAAS